MAVLSAMSNAAVETGRDIRLAARAGFTGLTVGRARGYLQANLAVIPAAFAPDFEAYCHANPQACPLLGISRVGDPAIPALADDLDLRSDLPGYLVHDEGSARHAANITDVWRDDLVAFAIGCWFGAEAALAAACVRMRHVELGIQGPLFRTNRDTVAQGPFKGPLVVSMRPFANAALATVKAITGRLHRSHGAPIHEGDPATLGIAVPDAPDWGEPLLPLPGETTLFWACGLTALSALQQARLPFFVTHAPGKMLVTDIKEEIGQPC
jgi:uncharacterized protein YcsI (UPF0317 family)